MLLDYNSNDCCLWNPNSNEKIKLAPLPKYNLHLSCLLSAPPYDPKCRVVFKINETSYDSTNDDDDDEDEEEDNKEDDEDTPPILYFYKPGYNIEYHKQYLQFTEDDDLRSWKLFNRKIYGLTVQKLIVVISDLDHESGLVKIQLKQPIYGETDLLDMPNYTKYLIQSNDNQLLYVYQRYFDKKQNKGIRFLGVSI